MHSHKMLERGNPDLKYKESNILFHFLDILRSVQFETVTFRQIQPHKFSASRIYFCIWIDTGVPQNKQFEFIGLSN